MLVDGTAWWIDIGEVVTHVPVRWGGRGGSAWWGGALTHAMLSLSPW